MISVECHDDFLKKNIISLLRQKKLSTMNEYSNKFFFKLKIYQEEKFLYCLIKDDKIKFTLPNKFNEMFDKIYDFVSNKNIYINNFYYYPFKQLIKGNEKTSLLSEIQNNILIYLLLNLDNGIGKIELMQNIWPKDKDIFLNKLDTHLTNLKNQIFNDLNYDIKFSSKSGILKLSIN